MANLDKLKALKPASGLAAPPTAGAGNVTKVDPPAPTSVEATPAKGKGGKGRPKLDYATRQLGARVRTDTFTRVQAIAKRERVGLGPLVDRMVAAWERQRLEEAKAVGPRVEGEDDDAYIARVFRL